jgi:hypothetical protein
MDADTLKTVIETIERLAYRAGAAEAERCAVLAGPITATSGEVTPAIAPAEHPTLARLRKDALMNTNATYADGAVAVFGTEFGDNVLWGELRAWARGEGGKA